ncbi:MAG: flagellar hook protein FlgE [Alphaproteobacteria bacterium]|nr:flagellar hook protein FlgE [Alphaproteobacteria bacterium]
MSINSAMLAGVSGLVANSSALAAISDNIANVNTVAYKRSQVDFSQIVADQQQGSQAQYSAGGVEGITRHFVSNQGQIQTSSTNTDMAISGDGFFVVSNTPTGAASNAGVEFTRDGTFSVDASGYLVNDSGLYLQGWPASSTGTFAPDPSDLTKLGPINVKNLGAAVQATGNVGIAANLDQSGVVSSGEATYNATTNKSMADYAKNPATGTKPDFTLDLNVTDSMGGSHKMEMAFLRSSAAPNEWHAEIYAVPASDVSVAGEPGQIAAGKVDFNQDGSINLATSTLFGAAGATPQLVLGASGTAGQPRWSDTLGLQGQTVNVDLTKLTQYAATSTVDSISNDGAGVGNIVGVQVNPQGVVSAIFDNSQVRKISQVAVATFPDANALTTVNGNAYQSTLQAGQMVLKQAGLGGAGQISPSSLEASTVDLSSEFTGLITTQKAYSASSKIITTADNMLNELINIIR